MQGMKLKDQPASERPRERLREKGPDSLSPGELVAILLRTGLKGTNVVQIEQGSTVQGPIVTPDEIAPGQSAVTQFPSVIAVSAGTPGDTSPPEFMIGPPRDITY